VGFCYSNGDSQMVAGIQGLHLGDPVGLDEGGGDVSASNHKISQHKSSAKPDRKKKNVL
jgi:hypothetical protein